jgi:chorismate mutase
MSERFGLDHQFIQGELERCERVLAHYLDQYKQSDIKNIMLHRLIAVKEQELKHLEFINKAYERERV